METAIYLDKLFMLDLWYHLIYFLKAEIIGAFGSEDDKIS